MIKDKNLDPASAAGLLPFDFAITTAVSQADKKIGAIKPGFDFEIVKVESFADTVTAAISFDVKIGAATAMAAAANVPVAATLTEHALAAAKASRRGTSASVINLHKTTNGTGAATHLRVRIWVRPFPMGGEYATS